MLVGLMVVAGCSAGGAGPQQAQDATEGMDQLIQRLNDSKAQIDATVAAMNAIPTSTDAATAYKAFAKQVVKLESMGDSARDRSNAMRKKGAAYFAGWEQQSQAITNPDLRAKAAQRRSGLQQQFDAIIATSDKVKDSFESLMESFYDIHNYRGHDLSKGGIESASGTMSKASNEAAAVKSAIDQMIADVKAVRAKISPAVQPAAS